MATKYPYKKHPYLPYVFLHRNRWIWRPYLGKGKFGKDILLAAQDASADEVAEVYLRAKKQTHSLSWVVNEYMASEQLKNLKLRTQQDYSGYAKKILFMPMNNGSIFGDLHISAFEGDAGQKIMTRYMDKRTASPVAANREMQFLKAVFAWGVNRLDGVKQNPCVGVKLYKETARDKLVSEQEYNIAYEAAISMRTPIFAVAMEMAYLCGARRDEIFSITLKDITESGIMLRRSKGSRDELTLWSSRLREAVNLAKTINKTAPRQISGALLLHDKNGEKYKKDTLDSAWQRVVAKAKKLAEGKGIPFEHFTFHDIKARAATERDKRGNDVGHKSEKMKAVYLRGAKEVDATE